MTLVDTNVLIDILMCDPVWLDWSAERLDECRRSGPLCLNEIGYAELSAHLDSEPILQSALVGLGLTLERMPSSALFAAGQAFRRYRAAGGPRPNVLADFFIGAHAHVARWAILTRDVRRYQSYFPEVALIAPAR
jgi:predicted nucleic acid-binding protein